MSTISVESIRKDNSLEDKLNRLKNLKMRSVEAMKLNHQAVVEENRLNSLPPNYEKKLARLDKEIEKETLKQKAKENNEAYERLCWLGYTAEECEQWENRKKRKTSADHGFASYEQSTLRQYIRLTKQIKPDMESYEEQKRKLGDDFYPNEFSLIHGTHKPSEKAIEAFVEDLEKQAAKRAKYSRRRMIDPDSDIDFINEKNRIFNKKIERFYGQYTTEIKQNLERGTAV